MESNTQQREQGLHWHQLSEDDLMLKTFRPFAGGNQQQIEPAQPGVIDRVRALVQNSVLRHKD